MLNEERFISGLNGYLNQSDYVRFTVTRLYRHTWSLHHSSQYLKTLKMHTVCEALVQYMCA